MNVSEIREKIETAVFERGCFIVDVKVSSDNDIELTVESEEGIVDMDDCVEISQKFQEIFDRDTEDYSLTVSSAGLDQPFKVLKQFTKAVGTKVEVKIKGGRKIIGELVSATENEICLKYEVKESVEGKKKKELVEHCDTFKMEDINSVIPHIVFE